MNQLLKNKIVVILGPTASGKSDIAVKISKRFNGEIISADSRQVYRGMDIGTGKVPISYKRSESTKSSIPAQAGIQMFYGGIPHHLLDVASPKTKFDVVKYQKLAKEAIDDILRRHKLPIICGGTGFYIQAIVDNIIFPKVKANQILRKKLEKQSLEKLLLKLKKLDHKRFKVIDHKNKRRIIRAIEIAAILGKVPKLKSKTKYEALQIGIAIDKKTLKKNIEKRLKRRLKQGMIAEVKKLHQRGILWKKLIDFGLEYKYAALYLQKKINRQEMEEQLKKVIWQYAKRQMTWFKKDKRIIWLPPEDIISSISL